MIVRTRLLGNGKTRDKGGMLRIQWGLWQKLWNEVTNRSCPFCIPLITKAAIASHSQKMSELPVFLRAAGPFRS